MVYERPKQTLRVYSESRYVTHGLVFVLRPLTFSPLQLSSRLTTAVSTRSSSIYSSDSHRLQHLHCKTPARNRQASRCVLQQPPSIPIIAYLALPFSLWVITMAHYTAYNSSTEPSSSSLAGWAGVPEHAGQARTNFDDGLANISVSNCDDSLAPFLFSSQPDEANGCVAPFFPPAPSFSSAFLCDAPPATDVFTHALLPPSGDAFINAPGPSMVPESEFSLQGDEQVGHLPPSSDYNPYGEPTFFLAGESAIKMPPPVPFPFAMGYTAPANNYGNIGFGYPLVQHMVGAAGAGPLGLMTGVDMNAGMPAFTFTAPGLAQFQYQGSSQVNERIPVVHVPERSPDFIDGGSTTDTGVGDASEPKKKRPKKDTTKSFFCSYEGCDAGTRYTTSLTSESNECFFRSIC